MEPEIQEQSTDMVDTVATADEPKTGYPADTPLSEMTAEEQVAYWKKQSRKHENAARAREKELADREEEARLAALSDMERAVEEARKEAREQTRQEMSVGYVDAFIKAQEAAGRLTPEQSEIMLNLMDKTKFLTDGELDPDLINKAVEAMQAPADSNKRHVDPHQGARMNVPFSGGLSAGADAYRKRHGNN